MKKETKLTIGAVALLLIAGVIFLVGYKSSNTAKFQDPPTRADIDKQISVIQNNPNMPEQAKAIAIGQIKARSTGFGAPVRK